MLQPELFKGADGEPLARVTLTMPEVGTISMMLRKHAEKHTSNVREMVVEEKKNNDRAWEAQGETHQKAGEWSLLHDMLDKPFWEWTEGIDAPFPMHPDFVMSDLTDD